MSRIAPICMAVILAACSRYSYDEESFQSVRQERSVLSLARFAAEKRDSRWAKKAALLIDKHYEYALKGALEGLAAGDDAGFALALLNHLRSVQDPRIAVHVSRPRLLSEEEDADQTAYFSEDHYYEGSFSSGASKGAAAAFPYQTVVFETSGYGFDPEEGDVSVDVSWTVRPGENYFGFRSIGALDEQSLRGITADITIRFLIPGQSGPFEFSSIVSPTSISYEAFLGMPTKDDLYGGMAATAFEMAMSEVWMQAAPPTRSQR